MNKIQMVDKIYLHKKINWPRPEFSQKWKITEFVSLMDEESLPSLRILLETL